jgi:hypothetical protein
MRLEESMRAVHTPIPVASTRAAWLGIALFGGMALIALWCSSPPAAVGAEAPPGVFSAARAAATWKRITAGEKPHPLGRAEHERVRNEIVAEFERLGIAVEVQESFAANGAIGWVKNVVARIPGKRAGKCVLLAAHYDSVGAGPGASDDGAGCAALLETARALALDARHENTIEILIDDGEEVALLGAQAFASDRARADSIGVVLNFEARGTCGRSQMFETSDENSWLMEHYARAVPHPAAVSLAYELYKRMPNDTDMTVFKRAGIAGLNFAFIGGVARYHTPKDDLEHLDPGSLQHHGEAALALAREFGDANLENPPQGRAAYTDVLGLFFVSLAETWCLPLAIACALVIAFAGFRRVRAQDARRVPIVRSFLAALAAILAATAIAHVLPLALVALRGVDTPWTAHPMATRVAVYAAALGAGISIGALVRGRRANAIETRLGVQAFCALCAIATAAYLPSACYVFLAPCAVAALVALCVDLRARPLALTSNHIASAVTFVAAAAILLPLALALEDGFEFRIGAAIGAQIGLLAAWIAPLFTSGARRPVQLLALTAIGAFGAACCVPAHTPDAPTWLNFAHVHDASTNSARWHALPIGAPLPASVTASAPFSSEKAPPIAWWGRFPPTVFAPAEPSREAPPELSVIGTTREGPMRVVRARLTSPRGGTRCAIRLPRESELRSVRRGESVIANGFARSGVVAFVGLEAGGFELEIAIRGDAPCPVDLLDMTFGLPANGARLLAARPPNVMPRSDGDVTVITRRVEL